MPLGFRATRISRAGDDRLRQLARLGVIAASVALIVLGADQVKRLDRLYFAERVKDVFAALYWQEDWSPLDGKLWGLDYGWLEAPASLPRRIAHALGDAGTPTANTLQAQHMAIARGLRILEVDLWLDERTGLVVCHHGPPGPVPGDPGCTLDQLARAITGYGVWLVLDLKTDFSATGEAALAVLARHGLEQRAIVQLYQPDHAAIFRRWHERLALPGPIVTSHMAHRSLNHVARHVWSSGARVLAIPLERSLAMTDLPRGIELFVHPVHTCGQLAQANALGASGVYALSWLSCD